MPEDSRVLELEKRVKKLQIIVEFLLSLSGIQKINNILYYDRREGDEDTILDELIFYIEENE